MSAIFKGSGYYTNGADAGRACYILDAICGQVDKPGNLSLKEWAPLANPVQIPSHARGKAGHPALHVAMGYPLAPDLPNARLPAAVLEGNPYPVKALWVHATNPVMSDPNRQQVQKMFAALELAVACELYMSETALECDVVLPETSFHEQAEIRNGMWLGPEVILCQPVVAPVGESKPPYEIAQSLARKMGWGEYFPYQRWEDWATLMLKDVPISVEELKEKGFWAGDVRFDKVPKGLPTPSGKIEIYSSAYADAGYEPYPIYVPRSVIPDANYPLQVTHSKLSAHCNIVTQNNPLLMEICPENWVEINAIDAEKYGVADGCDVSWNLPKTGSALRPKSRRASFPVQSRSAMAMDSGTGRWVPWPRARVPTPTTLWTVTRIPYPVPIATTNARSAFGPPTELKPIGRLSAGFDMSASKPAAVRVTSPPPITEACDRVDFDFTMAYGWVHRFNESGFTSFEGWPNRRAGRRLLSLSTAVPNGCYRR